MKKLIFCNLDLLKLNLDPADYQDLDLSDFNFERMRKKRDKFMKKFKQLSEDTDNTIYFYSRKTDVLTNYEKAFREHGYTNFHFRDRSALKDFVSLNKNRNNYFVFIGGKNTDFQLAVNTRSLYIVPTWLPLEEKPQKYGVHVDTVKQLYKFILTLNNQNVWYSKLTVDDKTTCYSLMDARYGYYAKTPEEKEMMQHFQELLKEGKSRNYYKILLYHFLAGMTNSTEFDDIELFGMVPSSNCEVNEDLYSFMTSIRCLKGKRLPKNYAVTVPRRETNLLIRHTSKNQAHINRTSQQRAMLGGNDEFATLCINPDYKKRIDKLRDEGRFNVCIFDDYMTHGNTFNSVRCLLESLGANKIIFISMGVFKRPFQKKEYNITGSVYRKNYSYQLTGSSTLVDFKVNDNAKQEVSDLYDIFNS